MPIRGGYDVQLGDYGFRLDRSNPEPYRHIFVPASAARREVAGELAGETALENEVVWSYTDWSGGEGGRTWYPDDPSRYDYAEPLNPRIPGQLTGRPARTSVDVNVSDGTKRPSLAIGQGRLWLACGQTLRYSEDQGATWSNATAAANVPDGSRIVALAGSPDAVYLSIWSGSQRTLRQVKISGGSPVGTDVVSAETATNPWVSLAYMGGRLYGWTGAKLFEFDVFAALPLTWNTSWRKVYDSGLDVDFSEYGGSAPGSWWAGCAPAENSVVMYLGLEGQTAVYEYDGIAGRPIWMMPFGLTAKSMVVQNGIAFIAGHWSGESQPSGGHGAMYALPLDTMIPVFVGWFRKTEPGANLQMQEVCSSYGNQIMVAAAKGGKVFIYDGDHDAISLLDDLSLPSSDKIGDMITVGQKRLVVVYHPQAASSSQVTVYRYATDEPGDRESSGSLNNSLYMGAYDAGYPHEAKVLYGFHVTFAPLAANQRIRVFYDADDTGSWTLAGTITSSTPGASNGRAYIDVAANGVRFYRLRVRIALNNNSTSGVAQPILYGVSPVAKVARKHEYWELFLLVQDELQARSRPRGRGTRAERVRDWLLSVAGTETPITFLDGARYASTPHMYTTHTVVVEEARDVIYRGGAEPDRSAEGACFVRLRAVPS